MKLLATILGLASMASAHTLFTTLFINGKNQGDGTCVRMPRDGATANGPIYPITGQDMACGRDGDKPVAFTCAAPRAATLTFEFRMYSTGEKPGAIDNGHLGPCAVYVKKVEDMSKDQSAGSGWFKIWEDGLDTTTGTWCVDRLIERNGLLSVGLPAGLPAGYYLVRPEILALHSISVSVKDPQFYTGCAQIFVQEGPNEDLKIPSENLVSIPGYVDTTTPGLNFDIYTKPLPPYPMPGPTVYIPTSKAPATTLEQKGGVVPSDCLIKNANWCGKPLAAYTGEEGCSSAVERCYSQGQACWDSAPPSGDANCKVWQEYCKQTEAGCMAKNFVGPPTFTGQEKLANVPGEIPKPWNNVFKGADGGAGGEASSSTATATTAAGTSTAVQEKPPTPTSTITATVTSSLPTSSAVPQTPGYSCGASASPLKVSIDGLCGGDPGQTCKGSSYGNCCSSKGQCGRSTRHCGCGCQTEFGECQK